MSRSPLPIAALIVAAAAALALPGCVAYPYGMEIVDFTHDHHRPGGSLQQRRVTFAGFP